MPYYEHDHPLTPNEQLAWQEAENMMGFTQDDVIRVRREFLQETERVSFSDLKEPFESPLLLQFDEGSLMVQLERWKGEDKPIVGEPILARVVFTHGDVFSDRPGLRDNDLILLDGASIEGTSSDNDRTTIARNCNMSFRKTHMSELNFFDPLEAGKILKGERRDEQEAYIERQLKSGWAKESHGMVLEIRPSLFNDYTPPVRQVLEGDDGTPVFPETS